MIKRLVPPAARRRVRQLAWSLPGSREYLLNRLPPDGSVSAVGHRRYVGTQWEEPGDRQLQFMVRQGLSPSNVLVDVACGSLRAGVHFIPYLDAGNYLGIEKEQDLLDAGVEHELGRELFEEKRPELIASDSFAFDRFSKAPEFGISVSLFSHLTEDAIDLCLSNLARATEPGFRFYATFLTAESRLHRNPPRSHAHAPFRYHPKRIAHMAERNGYRSTQAIDWSDPISDQAMYELRRL